MQRYSLEVIWNGQLVDSFGFYSENDEIATERAKGWIDFDEGEHGVLYDQKSGSQIKVIKK